MTVWDRMDRGHILKVYGVTLNQHSDLVSRGKGILLEKIYPQGE